MKLQQFLLDDSPLGLWEPHLEARDEEPPPLPQVKPTPVATCLRGGKAGKMFCSAKCKTGWIADGERFCRRLAAMGPPPETQDLFNP